MKQLLIVDGTKALNATGATPFDLSKLEKGAIMFWELDASTPLSSAPKKNFAIALGRGNNSTAFIIPEIDVNTLTVTVSAPVKGNKYTGSITIPSVNVGQDISLVLVKHGTVTHERNTWTATDLVKPSDTAETVAKRIANYYTAQVDTGALNINVTVDGATIKFEGTDYTNWSIKPADDLNAEVTETPAKVEVGGTDYIKDLASRCAAGKGYNLLADEGKDIYPGYPESVISIASDDVPTKGYTVFNLHFATKRDSGKQLNEYVYQYVHIAVPTNSAILNTVKTILGQPVLVNE